MANDLRERLIDLAADAPVATSVPPELLTRARRRVVARVVSLAAAVILVAGVAVGALRVLGQGATPEPAQPSETVDTFSDLRGKILYPSIGLSGEGEAVDPTDPTVPVTFALPKGWSPIDWSRDGQHILARTWQHAGLGIMNEDGTTELIREAPTDGWGSFSPDGSSVVFPTSAGLEVYQLGTSDVRTVLPVAKREGFWGPAWSPDGSTIVFFDDVPGDRSSVVAVAPDGSGRRVLTTLPHRRYSEIGPLEWSPDGSELLFWLNVTKDGGSIWEVDVDGSNLRQLTDWRGNVWPSWSPDGSRIAFVRKGALYTMAPDGTDQRPVADIRPGWAIVWTAPAPEAGASSG